MTASTLPEVAVECADASIGLARLVAAAGLATSSSDASRKIQQGGVRVDRVKVADIKARVDVARQGVVLEVGRRAVRVVFKSPSQP